MCRGKASPASGEEGVTAPPSRPRRASFSQRAAQAAEAVADRVQAALETARNRSGSTGDDGPGDSVRV